MTAASASSTAPMSAPVPDLAHRSRPATSTAPASAWGGEAGLARSLTPSRSDAGRCCRAASISSSTCRIGSTATIAGRCCWSTRRWARPARTAPCSTSCTGCPRAGARSSRSRRRRPRSSITTSCGARCARCRRTAAPVPSRRTYYEDVLVVKVGPELLAAAKVPGSLFGKHVWDERYEDIRAVEGHLARNGTAIRKFFRQVSHGAQKHRFLERLNTPEALAVRSRRPADPRSLGRLHARLRGGHPRDGGRHRAGGRRARRREVVHPPGGRGRGRPRAAAARPARARPAAAGVPGTRSGT